MYASNWYIISKNVIRSSNNAIANLTMGYIRSDGSVKEIPITVKLTCDINGVLS
jgi:hypothetical protein